MAFTTIQGDAFNGSSRLTGSTYTESRALPAVPTAGNFVVVAIYSNRGNQNVTINYVKLGSTGALANVSLYLLDNGASSSGGPYVLVYGGYVSTTPNGQNCIVNWTNSTGGTATLSQTLMEFSGAASVSTPANATKHRFGGGLIDSGSPGEVASCNLRLSGTLTYNGNGSELTISATTWVLGNPIPIVGSLITIIGSSVAAINGVPMLVKSVSGSTIVVNSTYNGSTIEFNNVINIYGSVVEQSATYYGGSQFPTIAYGILQWPGTSLIMTSYSGQKQPWIGAFVQNVTANGTRIRMTSAGCTIPTSGSFTIPVASTTGAAISGSLILHTQNGNVVSTYSGFSANTSFNNCTVNTYPSVSTPVSGYSYLTYPTSTTMPLLGVFPNASVYNPSSLGGLTNGDSTPTSTSNFPYYTITLASGGTATGSLVLMGGYATSGTYSNINAIAQVNYQATPGNSVNGGIWTFVPSTQALTPENASAVQTSIVNAIKSVKRNRFSLLIQTSIVNAIKAVKRNRFSLLIQTSSDIAIKSVKRNRFSLLIQTSAVLTIRKTLRNRYSKVTQIEVPNVSRKTFIRRFSTAIFTQTNRLTKRMGLLALIAQIGASRATRTVSRKRSAQSIQNPNVLINRTRNRIRLAKALLVESLSINRRVNRGRKAIVTQPVQAVVTRNINRGRRGIVTVNYSITTSRRRTSFRRVIATMVAVGKNIAIRPFHISTIEQATETHTLVSVSETATNNVDTTGEFTNENDLPPSDYNEPSITTPNDFNEPSITTPVDFTEPDWPTGEDVVPT